MSKTIYDNGVELAPRPLPDLPTELTPVFCNSFTLRGQGDGTIGIDFKLKTGEGRATIARISMTRETARLLDEALAKGLEYERAECAVANGQRYYMKR